MLPPHRPPPSSSPGDTAQVSEFRALPAPPSTGGNTTLRSWIKTEERPDSRPEPERTGLQGHQVGVQRRGAEQHFTMGPGPSPPHWPAPHGTAELLGTQHRSTPRHGAGAPRPPTYLVDGVAAVFPVQERAQNTEVAVRLPRPPRPPPVYGRHVHKFSFTKIQARSLQFSKALVVSKPLVNLSKFKNRVLRDFKYTDANTSRQIHTARREWFSSLKIISTRQTFISISLKPLSSINENHWVIAEENPKS